MEPVSCAAIGCVTTLAVFILVVGIIAMNPASAPGSPTPSSTPPTAGSPATASTACGTTTNSLIRETSNMLPMDQNYRNITQGKLGHEDHLTNVTGGHYCGPESGSCGTRVTGGAGVASSHTTDQERWYFSARWYGWLNNGMSFDTRAGSRQARAAVRHAKVVVTIIEPGKASKSLVASAEEWGPGTRIGVRNGINYGAPAEVYHYLGGSEPYSSPGNKNSLVTVAFAQDQSVKLGPCK